MAPAIPSGATDRTGGPGDRPPVLDVRALSVRFPTLEGDVPALDRVSVRLGSGEALGILGESGSGKTTLALAAMGLLPETARVDGSVAFQGELVAGAAISAAAAGTLGRRARRRLSETLSRMRWQGVSMIFQGSMNAFNPVYPIGHQIAEAFRLHTDLSRAEIAPKVAEAVRRAGLDPSVVRAYPHELSGGMRQRAVIAMALCLEPRLVLADEPTTGLDAITQARLIAELRSMRARAIQSLVVISHDLGVIAQLAERVLVLYAGRPMELGPVGEILRQPSNPYTRALIESYPGLDRVRAPIAGIPGAPPDPLGPRVGCAFAPRCAFAQPVCRTEEPPVVEVAPGHTSACHFAREVRAGTAARPERPREPLPPIEGPTDGFGGPPLLTAEQLTKFFDLRAGAAGTLFHPPAARRVVRAVDHLDLSIRPSEILAIVGESGSGKTTLGKTILRLFPATGGRLTLRRPTRNGAAAAPPIDLLHLRERTPEYRGFRRATQMIFQDPYDALDPNLSVLDIVAEPLIAHREARDPEEARERVGAILRTVQLIPPEPYLDRYPHELSGGERQRVAAARALVLDPDLLVADEPISMLDVSLRAGFLNLLKRRRTELGTSIVYITHDLASARYVADRILVLYLGVGVELGPAEEVLRTPLHPYTKALRQAAPLLSPSWEPGALDILGEVGNAVDVPAGCRFWGRCPYRQAPCATDPPPRQGGPDHWYVCHFSPEELRALRPTGAPPPGGG